MKKLCFSVVLAAIIAIISSCDSTNSKTPKANLSNDIDSLSYAIGASRTQGLAPYLLQMGIDSSQMEEFIKGFIEGSNISKDDVKKTAYVTGLQFGQQFGGQMIDQFNQHLFGDDPSTQLSKDNFVAGFIAGASNNDLKMNVEEAQKYVETKATELETKKMEKEFGFNKDAGYAFLEENKTKEGVVVLPSGLQYKIMTEGKGAIPTTTDRVKVHYRGTLIDGTVFDSSLDGKEPVIFGVTQVIPGWTEALTIMPVGSKWMLYIPQELAYGSQEKGDIKPFSSLVFEVELIDIVKNDTPEKK